MSDILTILPKLTPSFLERTITYLPLNLEFEITENTSEEEAPTEDPFDLQELEENPYKDFSKEEREQEIYRKDLDEYSRLSDIRNDLELKNAGSRDLLLSCGRVAVLCYVIYYL